MHGRSFKETGVGAGIARVTRLAWYDVVDGNEVGRVFVIDVDVLGRLMANTLLSFHARRLLGPFLVVQLGVIVAVLVLPHTTPTPPTDANAIPPACRLVVLCVHTVVSGIVFADGKLDLGLHLGRQNAGEALGGRHEQLEV